MKTTLIVILSLFAYVGLNAQSDKIVGYWLTAEKTSQVKIFKATNGKYYGKVFSIEDPESRKELDSNNPDPEKRKEKKIGLRLLNSFEYNEKENTWENGTIYDPDNGKTYDCYMWFEDDPDKLQIKGYVLGMRMLGRETTWYRDKGPREEWTE